MVAVAGNPPTPAAPRHSVRDAVDLLVTQFQVRGRPRVIDKIASGLHTVSSPSCHVTAPFIPAINYHPFVAHVKAPFGHSRFFKYATRSSNCATVRLAR